MTTEGQKRRDDIIDLRFLFVLWLKWSWIVIPLALGGAYLGYRDLQSFNPQYVAVMTVLPSGGGGQAAPSGQVSSVLSGLGLISLTNRSPTMFDRLNVVFSSISLADRLQIKFGLMQEIFRSSWDPVTQVWVRPTGENFERQKKINDFLRRNQWTEPNLESLAAYLGGLITVKAMSRTAFFEISVTHSDPQFALRMLNLTYQEADDLLREQDKIESEKRRLYLTDQLGKERIIDTRQALLGLLANEERTRMLLESDLPYVARIIEEAYVSSRATEPGLRQIFGLPIFVSVIIGFAAVTLIALFRRE